MHQYFFLNYCNLVQVLHTKKRFKWRVKKIENLSRNKKTATKKLSQARKMQTIVKREKIESSDSDSSIFNISNGSLSNNSKDNDVTSILCNGLFSKDTKEGKWIKCCDCFKWCHKMCASSIKKKVFMRLLS